MNLALCRDLSSQRICGIRCRQTWGLQRTCSMLHKLPSNQRLLRTLEGAFTMVIYGNYMLPLQSLRLVLCIAKGAPGLQDSKEYSLSMWWMWASSL